MEVSILQHAKDTSPQTVTMGQVVELIGRTDWPPGYQSQLLGVESVRKGRDAGRRIALAHDGEAYYNPQADPFLAWEVKEGCRRGTATTISPCWRRA